MPLEPADPKLGSDFIDLDGQKIDINELGSDFKGTGKIGVMEVLHSAFGHMEWFQAVVKHFEGLQRGDTYTIGLTVLVILVVSSVLWPIVEGRARAAEERERQRNAPKAEPKAIVPRDFTIEQLREFHGGRPPTEEEAKSGAAEKNDDDEEEPIYVAMKGVVFDVSPSRQMYGHDGGYHCFAGRESTRAMAKFSFEEADLANCYNSDDFGMFEQNTLFDWFTKFEFKYDQVGRVSIPPSGLVITKAQLRKYDGSCDPNAEPAADGGPSINSQIKGVFEKNTRVDFPIYIAVNGKVIDVSYGGKEFYGAGGPYAAFAGKDISRALATMSLKPEDIAAGDAMAPDKVTEGLTKEQLKILADWEKRFVEKKKYPVVGTLVA